MVLLPQEACLHCLAVGPVAVSPVVGQAMSAAHDLRPCPGMHLLPAWYTCACVVVPKCLVQLFMICLSDLQKAGTVSGYVSWGWDATGCLVDAWMEWAPAGWLMWQPGLSGLLIATQQVHQQQGQHADVLHPRNRPATCSAVSWCHQQSGE
jgi:hypothetical protein